MSTLTPWQRLTDDQRHLVRDMIDLAIESESMDEMLVLLTKAQDQIHGFLASVPSREGDGGE